MLYGVWLSLQRYDLRFPGQRGFVGLGNYAAVLSAPVFWADLAATAVITAIAVTSSWSLGLGIALILRRGLAGRRALHAALLLPYGIITVVAAFAWQYLATPSLSFLTDRAWLGERWSSFAVIIATEVWKATPFVALLLLAGLAAVPEELMDDRHGWTGPAAGSGSTGCCCRRSGRCCWSCCSTGLLDTVRVFDTVFIQTNGANGTETVSLLAYDQLAGAAQPRPRLGRVGAAVPARRRDRARASSGCSGPTCASCPAPAAAGRAVRRLGWYAGTLAILVVAVLPVLWIVSLSLKSPATITDKRLWPADPTLENYRSIAGSALFTRALLNSVGIGLLTTVLAVALATPAAYALTRLRFRGKALVLPLTLAVAVFPPVALVGPLFDLWRALGLYDTWPGLVIPYLSFALPLAMWTLTAFFRGLPWEMEEAGAGRRRHAVAGVPPGAGAAGPARACSPRRSWSSSSPGTTSSSRSRSPRPTGPGRCRRRWRSSPATSSSPSRSAASPPRRSWSPCRCWSRRWSSSAGWSPGSPPAWCR